MNKTFIAYILPIITLFGLVLYAFLNPSITGFATGDPSPKDTVNATINIFTSQGIVLPADAIVTVYLDEISASMGVDRFIRQSGGQYEYKQGKLPEINYVGPGYTGDYNYFLKLSDFGLGEVLPRDTHNLKIVVSYNSKVISESSSQVKKT